MERFYKIYKNTINMLRNRKYVVPEENILTYEEILKKTKPELTIIAENINDHSDKISVFFLDDDKIGVKHVRSYYEELSSNNIKNGILIVKEDITSFAKNEILNYNTKGINIEIYIDKYLVFDITTHVLVPKHELLDDVSKNEVFKKYHVK